MDYLKNIEIDLLFRIDFLELMNDEQIDSNHSKFEVQKKLIKDKYDFKNYFNRSGYYYVRLSEIKDDLLAYKKYLSDLIAIDSLNCCQLEQAIGLFHNSELKAFLSTDVGLCYDSLAHFNAVEAIITKGESNLEEINTFYGKLINDNTIKLYYSLKKSNIDISNKEELACFHVNKDEFEMQLNLLKSEVALFFLVLAKDLKKDNNAIEMQDFIDEVFLK